MKLKNSLYCYPEKGMLDCNTYVIKGNPGIIVDPGSPQFWPSLWQDLARDGFTPGNIDIVVNTHLHIDHCGANEDCKESSGAKITLHLLQKEFYEVTMVKTPALFGLQPVRFAEDSCFENSRLAAGDMEWELIPAPGHSPDSICYYCRRDKILICGDVIFDRSIGRVDLPGGSADALLQSIGKLSQLEIEYLLPGHMGIVTGSREVKSNFEFIQGSMLGWL